MAWKSTRKVAISAALPPEAALPPVALGFNHKTHSADPVLVIDYSTDFPQQFFKQDS